VPAAPLCPVFGQCGGCQYQHISYPSELKLKEQGLKKLFLETAGAGPEFFAPIVASPKEYRYRIVLDVNLVRIKSGEVFIGFSQGGRNRVVPAQECLIARESISKFFPELRQEALAKLTSKYRVANLVVKTGDDDRVFWGGIGRRSLCLAEGDYLWTEINGKRIFYSLSTFFQANHSILPELMKTIQGFGVLGKDTVFYDLYGGVGLFGIYFADQVKKVVLIEENIYAVKLAEYNRAFHQLENFEITGGRVEEGGVGLSFDAQSVVMVDPPRAGLAQSVVNFFCGENRPGNLLYLSCNPESLARDLRILLAGGWKIERVVPFDFFPKTRHLETLVWMN